MNRCVGATGAVRARCAGAVHRCAGAVRVDSGPLDVASLVVALAAAQTPARAAPHPPHPAPSHPCTGRTGALSPRNANYDIDVTLDRATRTLTGSEVIRWRNIGGAPPIRSACTCIGTRSATPSRRGCASAPARRTTDDTPPRRLVVHRHHGDRARRTPTAARRRGPPAGADLRSAGRSEHRRSIAGGIALPAAVPAGGEIRAPRSSWTARIPRTFDRTGVIGNYFFVSQWFPKLGVFERGGWTAHQFFANTEFFSDFGRYDVRMTVPRGWTVGATGIEQSRTDNADGTTTHRYVQDDVHDFAWTTSPDFIENRAAVRASGPAAGADAAAAAARASRAGRSPFRGDRRGAAVLRRVVRRLSVRPHHDRRSGVPERVGRHGVPDDLHRRHALAVAAPATLPKTSRCTKPDTSSGTASSPTTRSSTRGWTKASTSSRTRACSRSRFQPNYLVQRFFGDFIPWQYRDIPLQRATDTNWMNAYRGAADRDEPSTPT